MTLRFEVLVPDGIILSADVVSVQAEDASGRYGLRTGRYPFLSVLTPCVIAYRTAEPYAVERYVAVDRGVLRLDRDVVTVVTREAAVADRLEDVASAAAAMLAARQAQERAAHVAFTDLETILLQQFPRLERRR